MKALDLVGLLVYTFGAFAYGTLLVLWLRELGRLGWAGRRSSRLDPRGEVDAVNGALVVVSFLWFCGNLALALLRFTPHGGPWQLDVATICLAFAFPPLIMHVTCAEVAHARTAPVASGWRALLWPAYALAVVLPSWSLAVIAGPPSPMAQRLAEHILTYGLVVTFIAAALYAIALTTRQREARTGRERQSHRWMVGLFSLMVLLFLMILVISIFTAVAPPMAAAGAILEIAVKSLPLVFMFVGTYHENRFQFVDLFVKRGVSLLVTIGLLTTWFALVRPLLPRVDPSWAAAWIDAIVLLPVAVSLPWVYSRLGAVLDRRWLGRRFTTVDAVKHFLGRLRSATTETQLVERAQTGLGDIFGAQAVVAIGPAGADCSFVQEVPIGSGGAILGRFLMGQRVGEAPYFSEDVALLTSLADVFASVMENMRLQTRQQEQDRRARELTLHASRSELKALRAQINPHFLFNALNSIAGLIHRDPAVADRTIEQLADVFRYALRGAESEWAILDDEIEFVRAYLSVERARFGERLQADVQLTDDVRAARLPTMMIQTLVENAVKHGVASVRGGAVVEVRARRRQRHLVVSVADNGPGFDDTDAMATGPASGGYGLVNIRQRLDGYFGAEGALTVTRDPERGLTVVSVSLPLLQQEPLTPFDPSRSSPLDGARGDPELVEGSGSSRATSRGDRNQGRPRANGASASELATGAGSHRESER